MEAGSLTQKKTRLKTRCRFLQINVSSLTLALASSLLVPLLPVKAQSAPPISVDQSAQELLRQQERERQLREQQERTPDVRLEAPAADAALRLPIDERPCFPIRRIELAGEAADRFRWALKAADPSYDPATGGCLGTEGVNTVLKRVQNAIVARGFVTTRVLAAPQDLTGGVLTLTLLPGRIRAIRFVEGTDSRATVWNALPAQPGDLLNLRDIEQGLENFKHVPTAEADYLSGSKSEGKAIFDDVLAHKPEAGDLFRIARVYREAGDWEQAKALFERALREEPDDSKGMAEVGSYYLMRGDRAAAEALFDRSFKLESDVWSTVAAAGSYLGVAPQE